jgi:lipopolysaccharide exporter
MLSLSRKLIILERIKQSKFATNSAILFGGTALAQLIAIISYPVLSRLYSPESFGLFASVMAVSSIVIPVASLRYESAIVIEKDNDAVIKLQSLCLSALLCTSLSCLLLLAFYPDLFTPNRETNSVGGLIYFAAPIIFLFGMANVLFARLNRESRYKLLSSAHIARKFTIVLSQLILSLFGIASFGLLLGNLFGAIVAISVVLVFGKDVFGKLLSRDVFSKDIALRYLDFPKYSAPQSFINGVMAQMPILTFGIYYGAGVVGSVYLATKIVQLPLIVMGQSVRTVFLKHAADNRQKISKLYVSFTKITLVLTLIIIIPIAVLFYCGPDLFELVFGNEWRQAGTFSGWLAVWFGANFVQQPSRALFIVFEKQRNLLWIDVSLGVSRLLGLIISISFYDVLTAIAAYSVISFIFFTFTVIGWFVFLRNRC